MDNPAQIAFPDLLQNDLNHSHITHTHIDKEHSTNFEIALIRKVLEEQNVFIPVHCDKFIIRCLRVKDYNIDKATKLLVNFGIMMQTENMKDLYKCFKPSLFKGLYEDGLIVPLLKYDSQGRLIILGRIGAWNPNEFDFDQVLAACIVLFNYSVARLVETQSSGVQIILDFRDWTLQQIRSIKIKRLKLVVKFMQDSAPAKIKGVHLIHHPRIISIMFSLMRPFLKHKMSSRFHFHGDDMSSLNQFIDADILPKMLDGSVQYDHCIDSKTIGNLIQDDRYCQEMVDFGFPSY